MGTNGGGSQVLTRWAETDGDKWWWVTGTHPVGTDKWRQMVVGHMYSPGGQRQMGTNGGGSHVLTRWAETDGDKWWWVTGTGSSIKAWVRITWIVEKLTCFTGTV